MVNMPQCVLNPARKHKYVAMTVELLIYEISSDSGAQVDIIYMPSEINFCFGPKLKRFCSGLGSGQFLISILLTCFDLCCLLHIPSIYLLYYTSLFSRKDMHMTVLPLI